MKARVLQFIQDEAGAVTLDWVILTAAAGLVGLGVSKPIWDGAETTSTYIGDTVQIEIPKLDP